MSLPLIFPVDTKKVVGCDLDDVLANFIGTFMEIAHRLYGVDKYARPTSWEWDDTQMTAEMVAGVWQEIFQTPYFWEKLAIEPGASLDKMYQLNEKCKVYFPTARALAPGDDVGVQSARWLLNNFHVPFPTVIVSNEKGPLAAALKYDYFIDDRPKNCLEVKQARPECKVFLKTSTHNLSFDLSDKGIPRVADFDTFVDIVLSEISSEE
jgi:5'(3')-deoxyribonucleotidase